MLPVGGLFIVLFIGWYYKKQLTRDELSNMGTLKARYIPVFMFLVRYAAPIAITMVFLYSLGILKF